MVKDDWSDLVWQRIGHVTHEQNCGANGSKHIKAVEVT